MAANKIKQNLRYQKCAEGIEKKQSFKYLSKLEKEYVKIQLQYKQVEKELDRFWKNAPRIASTGAIDWDLLSASELDYFEMIYKKSCSLLAKMNRLEEKGVDSNYAMDIFNQVNNHSICFRRI